MCIKQQHLLSTKDGYFLVIDKQMTRLPLGEITWHRQQIPSHIQHKGIICMTVELSGTVLA